MLHEAFCFQKSVVTTNFQASNVLEIYAASHWCNTEEKVSLRRLCRLLRHSTSINADIYDHFFLQHVSEEHAAFESHQDQPDDLDQSTTERALNLVEMYLSRSPESQEISTGLSFDTDSD